MGDSILSAALLQHIFYGFAVFCPLKPLGLPFFFLIKKGEK